MGFRLAVERKGGLRVPFFLARHPGAATPLLQCLEWPAGHNGIDLVWPDLAWTGPPDDCVTNPAIRAKKRAELPVYSVAPNGDNQ